MTTMPTREVLPDHSIRYRSAHCEFRFRQLTSTVLLVEISGLDRGDFGSAPLDEIRAAMHVTPALQVFIDARNALAAVIEVSDQWTAFFANERRHLKKVHVLASSKLLQLTVAVAQHFSQTRELIEIYSDPARFEAVLSQACLS